MEISPSLSIIVVTFNNATTIEPCLESIFQQQFHPSKEIIVVDNCSTDGTVDLIAGRYGNRIKLVRNARNGGFANGVNLGIHAARGHVIFLLNPDAKLVESNLLHALYELVVSNSVLGAVSPSIVAANGEWMGWGYFPCIRETLFESFLPASLKRKFAPLADYLKVRPPLKQRLKSKRVETGSGGAMMFQRARIEEIGEWEERYFMYLEDVDFCFRLTCAGYYNFWFAEYTVEHTRMHSSRQQPDRLIWLSHQHYVNRRLFLRKYNKHIARVLLPILWYASHFVRWLGLALLGERKTEIASVHRYWIRTFFHGGEP